MKHFLAVLLFAVIAGLVSCEVASKDGVRGIPETFRSLIGAANGVPIVAKIEASAIDAADVKAKVSGAVAEAKAKVAEVAEKAVEAAQPDRSSAVTPARGDADPVDIADAIRDDAADPAPTVSASGVTHFYGSQAGTAVAAWASEAAMNPEYEGALADAQEVAQVDAPDEPIAPATEPATEAPVVAPAAEPQAEPVAAEEPAPVSLGGVGQTSYFGVADKADAEQPWAAEATVFADANEDAPAVETTPVAAEPEAAEPEPAASTEAAVPSEEVAPVSLGGIGQTSYFGLADKPDSDHSWAAAATMNPDYTADAAEPAAPAEMDVEAAPAPEPEAAAPADVPAAATEEPAPATLGGVGQTSLFGLATMPDADRPWAAEAAMNPDYTADAAVPVEPAAEPATDVAARVEEPAPVSLGGIGQTSYFGIAEKADATQAWAAAAAMNPEYSAADPVAAPAPAPATEAAIENCRDALNAEAQAGGLNFALTSWAITPDNFGALDKLAKLAKDCGGVMIEVGGHTDNTGRPASNKTLSELRAKAVVTYLVKAGVDASKLKAVGYGEEKPVGDNATVEGRRQNRRIEFLVTAN